MDPRRVGAREVSIADPEFLLGFLIVALEVPPELCQIDQPGEGDVARQGGEPVLGRLGLTLGPFDQKPFLGSGFRELLIALSRAAPQTDIARDEPVGRSLAPGDPPIPVPEESWRVPLDRHGRSLRSDPQHTPKPRAALPIL